MFEYLAYDTQQRAGIQLHFEHGSRKTIDNILMAWGKTPDNSAIKYPLFGLIQPFEEIRGRERGIMAEARFTVVLASLTSPSWSPDQRLCNSFLPILYPLYNSFIEAVKKSGYFMLKNTSLISHVKTDVYQWGEADTNVFSDYVDAILISNLELKIINLNCS
jgi:hypothetical protein